eukprot:4938698-Pyramimonas_sp.AAC.1
MGSRTKPARPVRDPIQSLHAARGVLYRAYTPCLAPKTDPTRPVRDPIQSLRALHGILYGAYTACTGS